MSSTHEQILSNINAYVNLQPQSMQCDIRESLLKIYDQSIESFSNINQIARYAKHPSKDASLAELEQALYDHERPYYAYCASGAGSNPSRSDLWKFERNRLSALISMKNGSLEQLQQNGFSEKSKTIQKIIDRIVAWF